MTDLNLEIENLTKEYRNAENTIKSQNAQILELRSELETKYAHMLTNKQ